MVDSKHFGLIGGLGVGATVIYYEAITAAHIAAIVQSMVQADAVKNR